MTRYQQTWNFIVYGQSEPVGFLVSWVNCWVYGDELTVLTLWQTYKKPRKITIFNGKTHYKWPFSIAMLVYQRVDG